MHFYAFPGLKDRHIAGFSVTPAKAGGQSACGCRATHAASARSAGPFRPNERRAPLPHFPPALWIPASGMTMGLGSTVCVYYGPSVRFLGGPVFLGLQPRLACYRAVGAPDRRATVDARAVPFPTAPALRMLPRVIRRFRPGPGLASSGIGSPS